MHYLRIIHRIHSIHQNCGRW